MKTLSLIGRSSNLFGNDLSRHESQISSIVSDARFLIVGGAGSIGRAVTKEIFKRNPKSLHVVDISENNMVELVRDIRSTLGYGTTEFKTFAIDCGSIEFEALMHAEGPYDYIFNLSAMKHVRSEKDPFTLMRMITVNVSNTIKVAQIARKTGTKKYFCVSTDKAANPVNMMGASKRLMEMFLMRESLEQDVSMARFANVAFSDGSLLDGFCRRFEKGQPFSAPSDVQRYFITSQEAAELCIMSGIIGQNRDNFFPKLNENLHLIAFPEIARRFLSQRGYEVVECQSEDEARERAPELINRKKWPCYFFLSNTSGEKEVEEFFTRTEDLDMSRFDGIGIVKNQPNFDIRKLDYFTKELNNLQKKLIWQKQDILKLFNELLPEFVHKETGKNLDQRM